MQTLSGKQPNLCTIFVIIHTFHQNLPQNTLFCLIDHIKIEEKNVNSFKSVPLGTSLYHRHGK